MHRFTVTLNTARSEYNDIEVELEVTASIEDIIKAAVDQTDIPYGAATITSYVIVGVGDISA